MPKRYGVILFIEPKDLSVEIDDLYEELTDQLLWFAYENKDDVNLIIGEPIELTDQQIIPEDLLKPAFDTHIETCIKEVETLQQKFDILDTVELMKR
jgi:hypothetical protein